MGGSHPPRLDGVEAQVVQGEVVRGPADFAEAPELEPLLETTTQVFNGPWEKRAAIY